MPGLVEKSDYDGIRVLSLARPPVNAIDLDLVRAIEEAMAETESSACRGLVVTGRPGIFSAGIDVKAVLRYDVTDRAEMLRSINRTVLALYGLPKPTVAAIGGHAIGGGLVLALTCDFRIAAEGSYQLGLTEVTAGIPFPAGPMAVVLAELDRSAARDLVLSGRTFGPMAPPADAFIDAHASPRRLLEAAIGHAAALGAAPAYATVKRQLRAETLRRLEEIVARDDDPMLRVWK